MAAARPGRRGAAGPARPGPTARAEGRNSAHASPGSPALTWYEPDQTVAFWIRRMAQETVVHRIDAELARPSLAGDDGVFRADLAVERDRTRCSSGCWPSARWPGRRNSPRWRASAWRPRPAEETDRLVVAAGRSAWTVRPSPSQVVVEDGAAERPGDHPRVLVEGAPDLLLRWLWGRSGLMNAQSWLTWRPRLEVCYLRRMLAAVTKVTSRPAWQNRPSGQEQPYLTCRPAARRRADGSMP